ncbi:MAG: Clp protease N-terminal domain-containing protein [Lawsonibacter sp.]
MADSRFTSTALGAIRLAQENAARLGHSYVGSEHLLLGLASQEYSPAAEALRRAGADSRPCGRPSPSGWASECPPGPCTRG